MKYLALFFVTANLLGVSFIAANAQVQEVPKSNQWKWTKEKWTGDNLSYHRTRIYIDKFINQGQLPSELAQKYRTQAKNWQDAKAQYRWAYAAYEAARKVNFVNQERTLSDIVQSLSDAENDASSRNYEYSRLRFLATARLAPYHNLKDVGARLVHHNPKDYETRFYLVEVLDPGMYDNEKNLALAHAQYLVRALPKKPTMHSLLGSVYWKIWIKSKSQADADKAIAAYQKFLEVAPLNHAFRTRAKGIIASIEKQQARYNVKSSRH